MFENPAYPARSLYQYSTAEVCDFVSIGGATLASWQRRLTRMKHRIGKRQRGAWRFTKEEVFVFHLLGALHRLGVPVNATHQVAAWRFVRRMTGPPSEPWVAYNRGAGAAITVDAPALWALTLSQTTDIT